MKCEPKIQGQIDKLPVSLSTLALRSTVLETTASLIYDPVLLYHFGQTGFFSRFRARDKVDSSPPARLGRLGRVGLAEPRSEGCLHGG